MNQPNVPQQPQQPAQVAQPQAPAQNSSFAAPIQNPGQAAPQPGQQPAAQPSNQQPQVAKTYMTREEYVSKFGDDAGFLDPGAWEQKKRSREQNYNPNDAAYRRLEQQMGQVMQLVTGFVQQSTTKDLSGQYADLYGQQQEALKTGNVALANNLEQQKLQIAMKMGGTTQPQANQPQFTPQQIADKNAANAILDSTEWAPDPIKMEQAKSIYAHLNSTRPDLSEVQKVIEVDKRIKSMGNYTQSPVMPSQTIIPNPPQQQIGNGVKDFANLPPEAKAGYDQLKMYRTDINQEVYAKNWYKRNNQ